MSNALSICSNALQMLGDDPITSFDEDTPRARRANNLYPSIKKSVLRSHPWNCATKRVILSPDVEEPAFDWGYQFTLPTDWLRTLQVGLKGSGEDYRTEGRKILCDTATLRLVYVANIDEGLFDAMLEEGMQMSVAATLCYATTASSALRDSLMAGVDRYMKTVRAIDGQDDPSESLSDELLLIGSRY